MAIETGMEKRGVKTRDSCGTRGSKMIPNKYQGEKYPLNKRFLEISRENI